MLVEISFAAAPPLIASGRICLENGCLHRPPVNMKTGNFEFVATKETDAGKYSKVLCLQKIAHYYTILNL